MRIYTKDLSNNDVILTGYLHDFSDEMPTIVRRPAVLVFPGGGYMMCSDREADPVALSYFAEGYNTFILRYSVGANKPCQLAFEDAVEALKHIRANDWELRIDANKITVMGFSAGGHLAAWLSVLGEEKPNATILGYPCTIAASGEKLGKVFPEIIEKIDTNTPPTFIFSASDDKIVPVEHTIRYIAAFAKAGVEFESHIFAGGGHGFSLARPLTSTGRTESVNHAAARWFELSVSWLKGVLGEFDIIDEALANMKLNSHAPLGIVRENEQIYAIFNEFFPEIDTMITQAYENGHGEMVIKMSLRDMATYRPEMFSAFRLDALDNEIDKHSS